MKTLSIVTVLLFVATLSFAQTDVETKIRLLDEREAEATIKGDTATLNRLWSPNYVVNNPANTIVDAAEIRRLMKEGKISYAAFSRIVEKVTVTGNVAVAMGYEVNQPQNATDNSGKTVTRRYTDVWMKGKNGWQIIARQATIIDIK